MYQEYIQNEDGFMIIEQENPSNSETKSKYKNWFGVITFDENNNFCNGERTHSDGTIVRYVNGYIDGNIYDHFGNVIYTHPAIEYPGGQEYWTKGYPHGLPAIQFFDVIDGAYYEEYWIAPCSAFITLQVLQTGLKQKTTHC